MTLRALIEKIKPIYTKIDETRLSIIFDEFIHARERESTRKMCRLIKQKYGLTMGSRQVHNVLIALEKWGYQLAPFKVLKMNKQNYIDEVAKTSTSSLKTLEIIYENLISQNRKSAHLMAKSLSTEEKEVNSETIKNITSQFLELGVKGKPVKIQAKTGPKKPFKFDKITLEQGVVRWNPPGKLLPEPFKHLDKAW